MNDTLPLFKQMFERELGLLDNPICRACDPEFKQPLLPWLVGSDFLLSEERVAFVGKPHRGIPGAVLDSGMVDPTEMVREDLWNRGWAYWRYTREIAEALYGSRAFQSIAMTNVIKCSNSHAQDLTTQAMARSCIKELGVVWKELELIKPRSVIFYTHNLYPSLLENVPFAKPGTLRELTPRQHCVACGEKQLGWWERACSVSWYDDLRILVAGHPERKNKAEFIGRVLNWIRRENDA